MHEYRVDGGLEDDDRVAVRLSRCSCLPVVFLEANITLFEISRGS